MCWLWKDSAAQKKKCAFCPPLFLVLGLLLNGVVWEVWLGDSRGQSGCSGGHGDVRPQELCKPRTGLLYGLAWENLTGVTHYSPALGDANPIDTTGFT